MNNVSDDDYPPPTSARVAMSRACNAEETNKMIASKSTEIGVEVDQKIMESEVDFSDDEDDVNEFDDDI